jgi:hypothetical protein
LESHRHLRTSIIDSIVGEFPAVILTVSFVIRCSATSHIVKRHILGDRWNVSSMIWFLVFEMLITRKSIT